MEEIGCVVLKLGYFIDFSGKGLQDPLSVVLSLTGEEQEEERVDISINEMLEEYVWSKGCNADVSEPSQAEEIVKAELIYD